MIKRTYAAGFREIGAGQPHSRTEYRTDDGRTFSANGTGEEVRAILINTALNREG